MYYITGKSILANGGDLDDSQLWSTICLEDGADHTEITRHWLSAHCQTIAVPRGDEVKYRIDGDHATEFQNILENVLRDFTCEQNLDKDSSLTSMSYFCAKRGLTEENGRLKIDFDHCCRKELRIMSVDGICGWKLSDRARDLAREEFPETKDMNDYEIVFNLWEAYYGIRKARMAARSDQHVVFYCYEEEELYF